MKKRLESPLHLLAYFLNPYYSYTDSSIFGDEEVMDGFISAVETFYHDDYDKAKKKWKTLWQAKSSPQWGYAQIQTSRWPLCKTCINGWLLVFVMYFISASCWNVSKFIYLYTCAAKWWENYGTQVQHCKGWPVVVVNLFIFVENAFSMAGQLLQQ